MNKGVYHFKFNQNYTFNRHGNTVTRRYYNKNNIKDVIFKLKGYELINNEGYELPSVVVNQIIKELYESYVCVASYFDCEMVMDSIERNVHMYNGDDGWLPKNKLKISNGFIYELRPDDWYPLVELLDEEYKRTNDTRNVAYINHINAPDISDDLKGFIVFTVMKVKFN